MTVLGTVLPPLIIISIISFFYQAFRDNIIVNMAMTGMLAGVAAVLCDVVITMGMEVVKKKRLLPIIVLLSSFAAVRFFKINIVYIILVCGLVGALDILLHEKIKKGA